MDRGGTTEHTGYAPTLHQVKLGVDQSERRSSGADRVLSIIGLESCLKQYLLVGPVSESLEGTKVMGGGEISVFST